MLSGEQRERAKQRWIEAFDRIYPKCERLFQWDTTLVISDAETMVCYGEDGKQYILQVAPWEKNEEEE